MVEGYKRQVLLLSLLDELKAHGSWCGETHIQKTAFFLEGGLGVPLGLAFYMYKYGPFSSDLRQLLGELRASYLIDIEPRTPYGPSLIVSDAGRELMGRFPKTQERYRNAIEFVAGNLGARSVADLERLSTALFVRKEGILGPEDQARRLVELKPHVELHQAEEAVETVDSLLADAERMSLSTKDAVTF